MITGAHAIIFTKNADAVRAFLRDVLEFPSVDAGDGWLIFALPAAELAAHPADDASHHELYLMWDGIEYEQIRVPVRRRDRDEVADLTGQRWVPVLVHEDDVIHDSRRIVEYLDYLRTRAPESEAEPARGA